MVSRPLVASDGGLHKRGAQHGTALVPDSSVLSYHDRRDPLQHHRTLLCLLPGE